MSDPQHLGLDELGQRVQAMGDPAQNFAPAPDQRLRPYQGAPLPVGPAASSRLIPPYEAFQALEDLRVGPPAANPPAASPFQPGYAGAATSPASQNHAGTHPQEAASATAELHAYIPVSAPASANPPNSSTTPKLTAPTPQEDPNAPKSGINRFLDTVRSTIPLIQKLLPLLDGNFATAISSLVAPQLGHHPPPPKVDLEPVERSLTELRTGQRELRTQVQEQVTSLKRVEDQLDRVREATDRNTLEQQELVEDLRAVGSRISSLTILVLVLLLLSLGVNVYFLVQLQHILR